MAIPELKTFTIKVNEIPVLKGAMAWTIEYMQNRIDKFALQGDVMRSFEVDLGGY